MNRLRHLSEDAWSASVGLIAVTLALIFARGLPYIVERIVG